MLSRRKYARCRSAPRAPDGRRDPAAARGRRLLSLSEKKNVLIFFNFKMVNYGYKKYLALLDDSLELAHGRRRDVRLLPYQSVVLVVRVVRVAEKACEFLRSIKNVAPKIRQKCTVRLKLEFYELVAEFTLVSHIVSHVRHLFCRRHDR